MKKDAPVYFGIKEIKETAFFVDESIEFAATTGSSYNYHVNLASSIAEETVTFTIEVIFREIRQNRAFMTGKSFSRFVVQNMKQYAGPIKGGMETVDFPMDVWTTLFSLSYSHARALLAKSAAGTKFSTIMLPLINPEQEFKTIFAKDLQLK